MLELNCLVEFVTVVFHEFYQSVTRCLYSARHLFSLAQLICFCFHKVY